MARNPPLIAVVDDDEDVRTALGRLVLAAGMATEPFASGEAFLESIDDHEPDCVVLDLRMHPMDGFEVQAALGRRGSTVPVVVITGHDTPEARRRAGALGARGYLCKPVDDELLLTTIGAVMQAGSP